MNYTIQQYIHSKLQQRKDENNFRALSIAKGLIDFYSNDYLSFARDEELRKRIEEEIKVHPEVSIGSTGSRLLSGNNEYFESLEKFLAEFHQSESALIFNSGFDANYGLLSTLPYRDDTIVYDETVHASLHDGIRNSKANSVSFSHNNLDELEEKLKTASGLKFVVVESVYSMDGDLAPLKEIVDVCEKYGAGLIVDEAHATGIFGKRGEGRIVELGLQSRCIARVHTFSKALGAYGAVVLLSQELKEFLVNYCRPFIFSTALPFHSLAAIKCSYDFLKGAESRREKLSSLANNFTQQLRGTRNFQPITSNFSIQSLMVPGNQNAKQIAAKIQEQGLDVRPILSPTVPKGKERIRICLHSFNTEEEVTKLAQIINSL